MTSNHAGVEPSGARLMIRSPFFTLVDREIARFMKVAIQTVVSPVLTSFLYLMVFGLSLGNYITLVGHSTYLAFLVPGLVMMATLNNAFQNSSSSIVTAKFSGDLEDLKVAPISYMELIWALGVGGLFRGFLVGFVTYLVGTIFHYFSYGTFLVPVHPFLLLLFLALGGLSFTFVGVFAAFWAKSFDHMAAVTNFLLTPLIYLGGVFFSLENLHPFWRSVAMLNPLFYFINGVRYGMLGVADVPPGKSLLISVVAVIVCYGIGLRALKKAKFLRW
jgi:ABC-2 type transport system permease protein